MNDDDKKQAAYALTKGIIGSIPTVGSLFSELFGWGVSSPYDKRRDEFLLYLYEKIKKIEGDGRINIDELRADEGFLDVLSQGVNIAMRNSQVEKAKALQNAIINSASRTTPDQFKRTIFLNKIDLFTDWHILFMKLFFSPHAFYYQNGREMPRYSSISLQRFIKDTFEELKNEDSLITVVWEDLYAVRFLNTSEASSMLSGDSVFAKRTTSLGDEFIDFIS